MNKDVEAAVAEWLDALQEAFSRSPSSIVSTAGRKSSESELERLLRMFLEEQVAVRREVVAALGERHDALSAEFLARIAKDDSDWRVRIAVVASLAKLDVADAVEKLMDIAQHDSEPAVRTEAIKKLGGRALKVWPQLAARTRSAPRPTGAIRTRGVGSSRDIAVTDEARAILKLLDRLRTRDPSNQVRREADATLGELDR